MFEDNGAPHAGVAPLVVVRQPGLALGVSTHSVICGLLARLSPEQWNDAFRAGGYSGEEAARYIKKLRQKVTEGLELG